MTTRAEKSYQRLIKRLEKEVEPSRFNVNDRVKYVDGEEIYKITSKYIGVFGGWEYKTQSTETAKKGIGFDKHLILVKEILKDEK